MTRIIMKTIDILMSYLVAIMFVLLTLIIAGFIISPDATAMDIISYFDRNENGLTFGSSLNLPLNPDGTVILPDMQLTIGVDGTLGYVFTSDLEAGLPNNPAEAVAYMRGIKEDIKNGITSRTIALYDVDGKTVIGEFKIQY